MKADLLDVSTHFQFGENWAQYSDLVDERRIADAIDSVRALVGDLEGKTFLDIGSGSGLFSLAALRLGASEVLAIDLDETSVATTRKLLANQDKTRWRAEKMSVFDLPDQVKRRFDVVYSWGVLHHTGDMWRAVDAASRMVADKGILAIALYERTPLCGAWTVEKRVYRKLPSLAQKLVRGSYMTAWGAGMLAKGYFTSKTSAICKLATTVTTGNDFLADYARERNDAVFVVPTSIDLDRYLVLPEPPKDKPFTVCWTGSNSTLVHFEHAREPLEQLARKIPLIVKVICNRPPEKPIAGAEMEFVPWSPESEAVELGGCHVGIMPLPDDEVSRGKCGLKALQCMATGRPVVASPVGVNREIVRADENGFLATTSAEWVNALSTLAADKALRVRLGKNARATVERGYSAEISAAKFARVVDRVVA